MTNNKTLILSIVVFSALYALWQIIFGSYSFNVLWHLGSAIFIGLFLAIVLLYLLKDWSFFDKKKKWFDIAFLLSIIGFLLKLSPSLFSSEYKYQLDNFLGKSLTIDVENEFCNKNITYVIFAYDKTEYNDSPTIQDNNDLQTLYLSFFDEIHKFCNSNKIKVTDGARYRDFFKAKICYDLLKYRDKNAKFKILIIGKTTNTLFETGEWLSFSDLNIKNAINRIFDQKDDLETNFYDFWSKVDGLVDEDKNQENFSKYVLYAYSDFIHDVTDDCSSDRYVDYFRYGTTNMKGLKNKSIIQNLYISPYNIERSKNPNNKKLINKHKPDSIYEYRIYANNDIHCSNATECALDNFKIKEIPLFYSENENSSPNFYFSDSSFKVRLIRSNSKAVKVKLIDISKNINHDLFETTFTPINEKGTYSVKFLDSNSTDITLDVAKENIHVFFDIKRKKNEANSGFMKFIIIIIVTSLSFTLTIEVIKRGIPFFVKISKL